MEPELVFGDPYYIETSPLQHMHYIKKGEL
jgi:hypothetical protein